MSVTRPLVTAGPMERQRKPARKAESSATGACAAAGSAPAASRTASAVAVERFRFMSRGREGWGVGQGRGEAVRAPRGGRADATTIDGRGPDAKDGRIARTGARRLYRAASRVAAWSAG